MNKKQIIAGVIILAIVGMLIWYLFFKAPDATAAIADLKAKASPTTKKKTTTTTSKVTTETTWPLVIGSKGTTVSSLQTVLRLKHGVTSKMIQGTFDQATKEAVIANGGSYPVDAATVLKLVS
jgi:hypothetical protein